MNRAELKKALRAGPVPERMNECKALCYKSLLDGMARSSEPRTDFRHFLSDVFRHTGPVVFASHALVLLLCCAGITGLTDTLWAIPFFMPLFILACLPSLLRGQMCRMGEIEAATLYSGAQLLLARLLLAAMADLVCLTIIITLTYNKLQGSVGVLRLILYAVVPLIFCVASALRCVRRKSSRAMQYGVIICVAVSAFAGCAARLFPQIYTVSAMGLWLGGFVVSCAFFVRELVYLAEAGKKGKAYGIIS